MDVNGGRGMNAQQFLNKWKQKYADEAAAVMRNPLNKVQQTTPPAKKTETPIPVMQSNPDAKPGASGGVLGDAAKAMQATGAMMVVPPLPTVVNQARVATVSAIPPAPQVKAPMRLPPPPVPKPAPERMGSKTSQQKPQITSMGDGIGQNVSDRDIAHAVTGGIGMPKWNG
jgi:hypothetical protein